MLKQLFKTKSLDAILHEGKAPKHQLRRALGSFDVVMLGIVIYFLYGYRKSRLRQIRG